jgi:hypothetical protein
MTGGGGPQGASHAWLWVTGWEVGRRDVCSGTVGKLGSIWVHSVHVHGVVAGGTALEVS